MRFATKIPNEIEKQLYQFSDWFFQQDLSTIQCGENNMSWEEATSIDYLLKRQNDPQDKKSLPIKAHGADCLNLDVFNTSIFYEPINTLDLALKTFVCSPRAALKMFYPPGGFIDWHNNACAYGYNILFTYSETGDGAFLYQHPITKEIVEMPDSKGWTVKMGCYDKEDGHPLWHAAYTKCNRLNWGYIVPDDMWSDLAEEFGIDPSFIDELFGTRPSFEPRRISIV